MSWKLKKWIRKWGPTVGVVAALFVAHIHSERGGKATVSSVMTSTQIAASKLPILGTYFKPNKRSRYRSNANRNYRRGSRSYAYGKKNVRRSKARKVYRGKARRALKGGGR